MTEQEAWMLACVIQAGEEQHGYIMWRVEADTNGEWHVVAVLRHRMVGLEYTYFHSPREWYETVTGE